MQLAQSTKELHGPFSTAAEMQAKAVVHWALPTQADRAAEQPHVSVSLEVPLEPPTSGWGGEPSPMSLTSELARHTLSVGGWSGGWWV